MKTKTILMTWVLFLSVITIPTFANANPEENGHICRWQKEMAQYGPTVFIPPLPKDRAPIAEEKVAANIVRLGIETLTHGIVAYIPSTKGISTIAKRNVMSGKSER